tara:strand:- start:221 stop:832 length:612 start_codon:yes stop_codon:yes gene_type:complete
MKKKIDDRLLEFIPQKMYEELPIDEQELIIKHRKNFRYVKLKEQRINTLEKKIKEQKELLSVLKENLTKSDGLVNHLRKNYKFNLSFGVQPPRPSKKPKSEWKQYCKVDVGRIGRNPFGISCGNTETFKKHLLEYYKEDKLRTRSIKRDFVRWMKTECITPKRQNEERIVYDKVSEWIYRNPIGFDNETYNYHDLFPLPKKDK